MLFGGETGNCPHCGVFVRFVQQEGRSAVNTDTGEVVGSVTTSVCPSCQQVVVFVFDTTQKWKRYPYTKPTVPGSAPPRVCEAFTEAQLAHFADAPHAAATMLRRTIASAATDLKVPDKYQNGRFVGLGTRIDGLKGLLIPATYEAAKKTKLLGDGGAHEEAEDDNSETLGPIDSETVGEAIEVVRSILVNLYELPAKVSTFATKAEEK